MIKIVTTKKEQDVLDKFSATSEVLLKSGLMFLRATIEIIKTCFIAVYYLCLLSVYWLQKDERQYNKKKKELKEVYI